MPEGIGYADPVVTAHSLSQECPAVPQCVADLRCALKHFLAALDASSERCADIGIAVCEAIGNSVVHAYRFAEEPGLVSLRARAEDDVLEVVVADRGCGMQPRPDSPGLGLGLPLIARLSSTLEIDAVDRDGRGTRVTMTFSLRG